MRIIKDGISKNIDNKDWEEYCQKGWKKLGGSEPQPSQDGLYVVDDYTIAKKDIK